MGAKETGNIGEQRAAEFLQKAGFQIICRNYHSRFGEIDIIAKSPQYIVFAEVKTRKPHSLVSAAEAVNLSKQRKIIKTAMAYIMQNPTALQPRFDVLEVVGQTNDTPSINHIENAFCLEAGNGTF